MTHIRTAHEIYCRMNSLQKLTKNEVMALLLCRHDSFKSCVFSYSFRLTTVTTCSARMTTHPFQRFALCKINAINGTFGVYRQETENLRCYGNASRREISTVPWRQEICQVFPGCVAFHPPVLLDRVSFVANRTLPDLDAHQFFCLSIGMLHPSKSANYNRFKQTKTPQRTQETLRPFFNVTIKEAAFITIIINELMNQLL